VRSLWHERQRQRTPWIRREILKEADEQRLPRLLWRWHHARADDLWRRHVDPVAQRELSRAIEALRWAAAARNCAVPVSQMAVFLALAGRAQEAVAELVEARAKGEPLGATPEVVSLA